MKEGAAGARTVAKKKAKKAARKKAAKKKAVIAMATQGAHTGFQSAWSDIKKIASGADPSLAVAQIAANPRYKRIVDGLKAAAGAAVADADVLSLIGRVEVLPFDFQQAQSKD